jgi:hypothetical protein
LSQCPAKGERLTLLKVEGAVIVTKPIMNSQAKTVEEYLQALPPDRRLAIGAVRDHKRGKPLRGIQDFTDAGLAPFAPPFVGGGLPGLKVISVRVDAL